MPLREVRAGSPAFVHLRLHTEYSLVDGIVRVPRLMRAVADAGMPAVALTDHGNLFAMVKFHREAERQGVKPLIGADLLIEGDHERADPLLLTLIAKDLPGFRNLARLVSRSYLEGQGRGRALIAREWLDSASTAGLIALSGGAQGDIGRALLAGRLGEAAALLTGWVALFGDRFYLEVQRIGRPDEEAHIAGVLALVAEQPTPLVATNDVRFLARDEFEAHEARVCIHGGHRLDDPGRPKRYTPEQYLKTPDEMAALFRDLPEALENSVEIARRCSLPLARGDIFLRHSKCRTAPARRLTCADSRSRASHDASALRPRRRRATTPGSSRSSASSAGWGSRATSSWSRTSSAGPAGARSPWVPGAARAPVPWSRGCSASPISIRSATTCCSSAS